MSVPTHRGLCSIAVSLLVSACSPLFAVEQPALASLTESLRRLEDVEIQGTTRRHSSSPLMSDPFLESNRYLLRRSGEQAFLSAVEEFGRAELSMKFQQDLLLKNGELVYIQKDLDSELDPVVDDEFAVTIQGERLSGPEQRADFRKMMAGLNEHAILFGLIDNEPLASYVASPAEVQTKNEGSLIRIDAKSRFGSLQAWLDPAYGHLPRRLKLTKEGADLSRDRRIDAIHMNGGKIWPAGGVRRMEYSADKIVLDRSDGVPYIKQITLVSKVHSAAGPVVTTKTDATVTEIAFDPELPDEAFQTEIEIPEGFDVTVEGAMHLPYVWNGTWAVPTVEYVPNPGLFARVSPGWRRFLLAANLVLFAGLIGFLVFRKWRAAAGS